MRTTDLLSAAWQGVRRRPLRSALTALSLLIGVVTVVLVQGSGTLLRAAAVQRAVLAHGPSTTLQIPLHAGLGGGEPAQERWRTQLARTLADVDGKVVTFNRYPSTTFAGGGSVTADVVVVGAGVREIRPWRVVRGSWFGDESLAPQFIVNEPAWAGFSALRAPLRLVTRDGLEHTTVTLIGVVDDGTTSPTAYLREDQAHLLHAAGVRPDLRSLLVSSARIDTQATSALVNDLTQRTGRVGEVGEITRVDQLGDFDGQLATTRNVFLAIAVLSLLVGSLGILNIGLATLRERAEELSLRRALGSTRTQVALLMLLEAQIVALASAGAAIVVAYGAVPAFLRSLTEMPVDTPSLPLSAALIGVAASLGAAMAGALAPSVRAARVPIASIMR